MVRTTGFHPDEGRCLANLLTRNAPTSMLGGKWYEISRIFRRPSASWFAIESSLRFYRQRRLIRSAEHRQIDRSAVRLSFGREYKIHALTVNQFASVPSSADNLSAGIGDHRIEIM